MAHALNWIARLASVLAICGCTTSTFIKAYEGPDLPRERVALLKPVIGIDLVAIDGDNRHAITTSRALGYREVTVALTPGTHEIEVALDTGRTRSTQALKLDLAAVAGHRYMIINGGESFIFRPRIEDRTDRVGEWCGAATLIGHENCGSE